MKFSYIVDDLLHQKEALFHTLMFKQLTHQARTELFKQNIVSENDFKNLVYFVFTIKDYQFIVADVDHDTLKSKIESLQTYNDWLNLPDLIPYYFIVQSQ